MQRLTVLQNALHPRSRHTSATLACAFRFYGYWFSHRRA